jgi:sialate O-acetylesterase
MKIEGDKVVVWNDSIQHPIAVRYAWADDPVGAKLYNKEGLPAFPFRTDNWPVKQ